MINSWEYFYNNLLTNKTLIPYIMKKYSFVASDCNVIVSASSKKEAVKKVKESGAKGADMASIKNVFIFN